MIKKAKKKQKLPVLPFHKIVLSVAIVLFLLGALFIHKLPSFTAKAQTASSKPNIILIVTDDQNVDSLPGMRKLMSFPEGSWVKFNNAMVNDSLCCPARATLLTGQFSFHTGVTDNSTGAKMNDTNTLPVWLDKAGYHTALIGRYLNGFPWGRGKTYKPAGWDVFKTTGVNVADTKTKVALDIINTATSPYFIHLGYSEPHNPAAKDVAARYQNADVYIPPTPENFNEADMTDKPRWIRNEKLMTPEVIELWRKERIASQRALLSVDDGIQQIVDALKAKGQLDNTMIIFMGDHGFSWGSHRYLKKHCPYEECSRTPLLVRLPGVENREENRLVSNVDIASTIAEYAGITPELPQDGKSFLSVINNTATSWKEEVLLEVINKSTAQSFFGIRVPGWKYVEYKNGEKELYDLTNDPFEMDNQANKPAHAQKQAELAEKLRVLKGV